MEAATVAQVIPHLKKEEACALERGRLVSVADIGPDPAANTPTVRINRMATPAHDKAIAALLDALTSLEFWHPETGAKMVYTLA